MPIPLATRVFSLASRPTGLPNPSDFRLEERPLDPPEEGQITVAMEYLSVDPYMRGRMRDGASYAAPVELGAVMVGGGVGQVIASRNSRVPESSYVVGDFGWREHATVSGDDVRVVDPGLAPISTALGVLGMPGLTAYFGVKDVCAVREGDSFAVSGAAGAVGSVAGQIAKILGCRVAGTAGTADKIAWLEELGFDAAFNYKEAADLSDAWRHACQSGVDAYFDNVGGPITDALFPQLNVRASVAVCGQIAQYNTEGADLGPRLLWHLIVKRARVQGFLVFDFQERYREGLEALAGWIAEGRLTYKESIVDGFDNMPEAFLGLFQGDNTGKQLVRVA